MLKKYLLIFTLSIGFLSANYNSFLENYDQLLKKYVELGIKKNIRVNLIDYNAWEKDPLHEKAKNILLSLKNIPVFSTKNEKIAFWSNLYNFLTIELIISKKEKDSIRNLSTNWLNNNIWKISKWIIAGKSYSLDDIEHEILRKMGNPSIHFAIVCASLSCPDLRKEAYRGDILDEQFKEQAIDFLENDTKGLKKNDNKEIVISKIFDWFEEDFGDDEEGILAFINNLLGTSYSDIDDNFYYNWKLNSK